MGKQHGISGNLKCTRGCRVRRVLGGKPFKYGVYGFHIHFHYDIQDVPLFYDTNLCPIPEHMLAVYPAPPCASIRRL